MIATSPAETLIAADTTPRPPGIIEPGTLYTLAEFKARMGWSKHAFRTARNNGLRIRRAGRRAYIMGRDVIAYLDSHCDRAPGSRPR